MKKLILLIFFFITFGLTQTTTAQRAYTYYYYYDEWEDQLSLGPAYFDLSNPLQDTLLSYEPGWIIPYKSTWAENNIYCTDLSFWNFFKIDPYSITQNLINQPMLGGYHPSLSYDVTTKTMFLINGSGFYKIDITSGLTTLITQLNSGYYATLACDAEGDLYMSNRNNRGIYSLDKYTGQTEYISQISGLYPQSLELDNWEFDRDNNILYWTYSELFIWEGFNLYTLDPKTGNVNSKGFVGNVGDSAHCSGSLAIQYTPKPLAVPNLLIPANLSSGISLTPTLDWDDVPNATKYTLQASLSRDFTTPVLNIENLTVSQYSIPDSMPLSRNTQYFWRVKAFNEGGDSTSWWSTKFRFRTIGNSISGIISYNNQAGTPLTNCTLSLKDSTGTTIAQTTSDSTGFYNFNSVYHGTYTIEASTDKSWGGLNMIDASLTRQKIAFLTEFTPLQTTAADVNLSNSVNMIDVALMRQKIAFLNPPQWLIPNYIFEKPTVIVNGENVTVNIKALCGGDVDGSWVPLE